MTTARLPMPAGLTIRDVVGWDAETWSRAVEFWLAQTRVSMTGARVLEVGAGPGGLSLWLAACGARVTCTDATTPHAAREMHARHAGIAGITYRALDARAWPEDLRDFDIVVAKSVTGALGTGNLEGQRRAIAAMIGALRAGGEYWFADNLAGSAWHRLLRRLFVPWSREWHYYDFDEFRAMFPPSVSLSVIRFGLLGALGRTETQRHALARVERHLRLERVLPPRWRYVGAGIARRGPT